MGKSKLKFNKKTETPPSNSVKKKQVPRALFFPAGISDGCTAWRMEFPRTALNFSKHSEVQLTNIVQPISVDGGKKLNSVYSNTNCVVMQRPVSEQQVGFARTYQSIQDGMKRFGKRPFRFIIDVDDIVHGDYVSKFNMMGEHFFDNKKFEIFKEVVKRSDELHVCSPYMRDFYKEQIGVEHVTYKPNLMPKYLYDYYDLEKSTNRYNKNVVENKKPRILWAGSATHIDAKNQNKGIDDFHQITDFIKKTTDKYQWVFFGALPNGLEHELNTGKIEFHKWVSIYNYPKKLMELNVDVMIAPLFDNVFNRAKSNIKVTEAGA